jgi:hypothetical protein
VFGALQAALMAALRLAVSLLAGTELVVSLDQEHEQDGNEEDSGRHSSHDNGA